MKRMVGWAVFVAALAGLGVLIYLGAPPTPRWSAPVAGIDQELQVRLAGDRLLTMPFGNSRPSGPLEVRDAATRELLLSAWEDRGQTKAFRFLLDGDHAAGFVGAGADAALRWVDLSTGGQREVPLGPGEWGDLWFSEDGRILVAQEGMHVREPRESRPTLRRWQVRLFDRASGRALGTLRLQPDQHCNIVGGRLLFDRGDRAGIELWDPATGKATLLSPDGYSTRIAPKVRRVLTERKSPAGYDLWSLEGPPKRLAAIPAEYWKIAAFSADERLAVVAPSGESGTHPLQFWDAATGRKLWEYPLTNTTGPTTLEASADGRWFAASGDDKLYVLDRAEKRLAWTWPTRGLGVFSPDSGSLIVHQTADAKVHIVDAATGRERAALLMPKNSYDTPRFHASGQQLWLSASGRDEEMPAGWLVQLMAWLRPPVPDDRAGVLLGLAWPSRREVLRLTDRGVRECHVADDGSFVVTVHDERGHQILRRWDIPQPKPWSWIIGAPLVLGAILLALRTWWKASGTRQGAEEARP
jgi:WD40 repeat protein